MSYAPSGREWRHNNGMPDDRKLDETIEETFPASDAPANTVETGIRAGAPSLPHPAVVDNEAAGRFELSIAEHTAFLAYHRGARAMTIIHTEVPKELRGQHLGEMLVNTAVDDAHARGLRLVVECPFAQNYLRRHPRS